MEAKSTYSLVFNQLRLCRDVPHEQPKDLTVAQHICTSRFLHLALEREIDPGMISTKVNGFGGSLIT